MSTSQAYEAVDYNDPLSILLSRESEDDAETDALESFYCAAKHRAKTAETERTTGDMMGASPFELSCTEISDTEH